MKKYLVFALAALLVVALVTGALAGKIGPAGKSNIAHLYLYEKDADWVIVDGGAWGKMKYNISGSTFDFVFNGHGLTPGENYTLIYYPDPWPGVGLKCLGDGTANRGGNVHIANSVEAGGNVTDAKIWLVLSADVDCDVKMIGWNPEEYLFEHNLIDFEYTP